jgi:hypothetical protein
MSCAVGAGRAVGVEDTARTVMAGSLTGCGLFTLRCREDALQLQLTFVCT